MIKDMGLFIRGGAPNILKVKLDACSGPSEAFPFHGSDLGSWLSAGARPGYLAGLGPEEGGIWSLVPGSRIRIGGGGPKTTPPKFCKWTGTGSANGGGGRDSKPGTPSLAAGGGAAFPPPPPPSICKIL